MVTPSLAKSLDGYEYSASSSQTLSLAGTVYLDVPLIGADVAVKCASQSHAISTKTNAFGKFVIKASDVQFPCILQASGGVADGAKNSLKLHSIAYRNGTINVTPITELSLAYATKALPEAAYNGFFSAQLPAETYVSQGVAYVRKQVETNQMGSLPMDAFSAALADGNANHQVLDAMVNRVALSQLSLRDLVDTSAKQADWHSVLVAPPSNWTWHLPPSLPEPLVPENNPMSEAKVELGRYLFYDTRLSGNKKFSCASCHQQDKSFTDGKPVGIGSTGEKHPRSPMSLGNVAYNARLTWANPLELQLEDQINAPMFGTHPVEMGVNDKNRQQVIQRIQSDKFYQTQFSLAFPGQDNAIRWMNIKKAISTFERTMLTGNSRYDRHARREKGVLWTSSEQNGYLLFFTSAKCFVCHGSFNFNDADMSRNGPPPDIRFHNTGLFNIKGTGAFPEKNRGIFEFTKKPSDMGKFRAPSLRNIAVTAPYMHDGSIPTLEKVLNFYAEHGRNIKSGPFAGDGRKNPFKSKDVNEIHLTKEEKDDIVAFLRTLTDQEFLTNPKFSDPFKK